MFKYRVIVDGCGRTDAMVHASQYFAQIRVKETISDDFLFVINKLLPNDISVHNVIEVSDDRNVQLDAKFRTYDYYFHIYHDPFISHLSSCYLLKEIDIEKIQQAVGLLTKYQDYRAFCTVPDRHNHTLCDVSHAKFYINKEGNQFRFQITANRFLQSMIRIIVQKLIEIGVGEFTVEEFQQCLISTESPKFLKKAYPQGLYLSKVVYPYLELDTIKPPVYFE